MLIVAVVTEPAVFVARTVKVPEPPNVPESTPDMEFKVNPAGRFPEARANVGAGVPEAENV